VCRGVRFDGEEGADGGALPVGELGAETLGVDDLFALVGRHLAEVENGTRGQAAAVRGHRGEGLHRPVVLLELGR